MIIVAPAKDGYSFSYCSDDCVRLRTFGRDLEIPEMSLANTTVQRRPVLADLASYRGMDLFHV